MYPAYPTEIKGCEGSCGAYGDNPGFSLVNKDGNGLVYGATGCKEYILDYTYYGFSSRPLYGTAVFLDEVRLLVGNWIQHIPASLDLLNQIETVLDIPHSIPFEVPNNKSAYVFRGSPRWLIAPPMLSLYGLLIRAGRKHTVGAKYQDTFKGLVTATTTTAFSYANYDISIWSGAMPAVEKILKYGDRGVFGQDPKVNWNRNNGSGAHGWGIQGLGCKHLKNSFPDFYYLLPEE